MRDHPENRPVLVRWPKPEVNILGVSPAGLRRVLLQAIAGAALLVWDGHSAWAVCSPAAANSVVAICSGAISSQYGSGVETGGDITVDAGTRWSVAGSYALYFGSLTKVANSGAISTAPATNSNARTVSAFTAAATLYNYAGASITATTSGNGYSIGFYAKTTATVATNAGSITATSSGTGNALAIKSDQNAVITNSSGGVISATSGPADAYGVYAITTATVSNAGSITAASLGNGVAVGVMSFTDSSITNTGTASVISGTSAGARTSYGVYSVLSPVTINSNAGSIYGTSASGWGSGVYNYGASGNITVTSNTGDIYGTSGFSDASGLRAYQATITVTSNSGNIYGTSTSGTAWGVSANTSATVTNNAGGLIQGTSGSNTAYGVYAGTTATVTNNTGGLIKGISGSVNSWGVFGNTANVSNAGSITAQTNGGSGNAHGVNANGVSLTNSGAASVISGTTTGTGAGYGVYANGSTGTVNSNAGTIYGSAASGNAFGVYSTGAGGNIIVTSNEGDIHGASGGANVGIALRAVSSSIAITNNASTGTIYGSSAGSWAGGAYAGSSITVGTNSGTIKGTSTTGGGYGLYSSSSTVNVTSNAGLIQGFNTAGGSGVAYGLYAGSSITVGANTGTISASTAGAGDAFGLMAASNATLNNVGSGTVSGQATGTGAAWGVYADAVADVTNAASASITASASGSGDASAVYGDSAVVVNHGLLSATGTSAFGVQSYGDINLSNDGQVSVTAGTGAGYGVLTGVGTATLDNGGTIAVSGQGAVYGVSSGIALVSNTGTLSASGQGLVYGVRADTSSVTNSGTLTAASGAGGASYAVWGSDTSVTNTGTLGATNSTGGDAYGIYGMNTATVSNASNHSISASTSGADAWAVYGGSNATITTNAGTITASTNGAGAAYGVAAPAFGDVLISANTGTLSATASGSGHAYGVKADNVATVSTNSGTLSASSGSGTAFGVYGAGVASASNTGAVSASSSSGSAYAVYGGSDANVTRWRTSPSSYRADATLDNSLNVSASAGGTGAAYGLYGGTYAVLTNRAGASLSATASGSGPAYGMQAGTYATVSNAATASISASSASGNAYGVHSNDASTSINNSGSISATSATGLSYGLYLSAGAASLTNSGSISGQTASVYAGAQVANLLNWQGGNAADAKSSALRWSGTLPGQYTLGVVSPTRYGQIWFNNPSGSMAVNLDSSSALALGSYAKAVTGVTASAITSASGTLGLFNWQLSLSDSSNLYWDLLVTPNGIATGQTKAASALNQSFMPYFFGGTLQIDSNASTVSNNFVLDSASTNSVALGSQSATFSGTFSNATGSAGHINFGGGGTAILNGSNSYTGGTGIGSGTILQIGNGGSTGSLGSGAVSNNGTLTIHRADAYTLANDVSGSGSLSQTGSGTTILTGTNTYSGATTISAGTLQIGDGGSTGSLGSGQVINNAALVFKRSGNVSVSADISGSGSLSHTGSGTTTLTGTNTYTGSTTISAGTLQIGNGGSSGTIGLAAILNNGSLAIHRADVFTLGNAVSGTGTLAQIGSGTTKLSGNNTYTGATTISAGTLQIGDGASSGTVGPAAILNNGTLAIHRSDAFTLANLISGTGALVQLGSGTTTLTGTNTYSGATTISAGVLQVGNGGSTGSLGSGAIVNNSVLRFNRSDAITISNTISGSGTLVQQGSGALTLNGPNSYAAIDNQSSIAGLTNYQGGAGASALQYSGALPGNYWAYVTSPTQYGQLQVSTYSGTMQFSIASGSSLAAGTYASVLGGIQASALRGATSGVADGNMWLLRSDSANANNWNLIVTSFVARPGMVLQASNLINGVAVTIAGGALALDSAIDANNRIKLEASTQNTLQLTGNTKEIAGAIINVAGDGNLTVTGAGTVIFSADNSYSGRTTIASTSGVQIGNGGSTGSLGSGTVSNQGVLRVQRTGNLSLDMRIEGSGRLDLDGGGVTTLAGVNTLSGGITVAPGTTLAIASSAALGSGPVALRGGSTVPTYFKITSSTSIANPISVQGDPVLDIAPGATVHISAPIANNASASAGDVLVQGAGTLALLAANTYTGSTTITAGASLALSDSGSIAKSSGVSNQGTLDLRGVTGSSVSLAQFSQGATGQLLMRTSAGGGPLLSVAGTANLNGSLTLSAQAGSYKSGVLKLITADQVRGTFSSLSSDIGNYVRAFSLLYSPQGVDLELVLGPDAVNSRQALGAMASAQTALMKQRNQLLSDMLSQECLPSQAWQSCMAIEGRHGRSTMGNEGTGLISGAWQVSPTLRMGGFVEQGDVKLRNGGVSFTSNAPNLGAFLRWNANTDGSGLQARVSFASHIGSLQMTRDKALVDTEAGSGTASLQTYALGAELAWAIPVGTNTVLKPYLGLQDTRSQRGAYTEASAADVAYPISYEAFEHNNLYTTLGLRISAVASERFSYQLSGGLQYKEKRYGSDLSGSSPIYKLDAFALDMRDTSANPEFVGSADLRYHFGKYQQVTAGLALRGPISDAPQVFKATLGYQVSF